MVKKELLKKVVLENKQKVSSKDMIPSFERVTGFFRFYIHLIDV